MKWLKILIIKDAEFGNPSTKKKKKKKKKNSDIQKYFIMCVEVNETCLLSYFTKSFLNLYTL